MLREILERDLLRQRPRAGRAAAQAASRRWREKYGVIGDIRGKGLFQGIEFVRDREDEGARSRRSRRFGVRVGRRALENGLLCRFDPHWIAFGPPLISTAEQIDEMVAMLDRSLGEVLGGPRIACPRTADRRRGHPDAPRIGAPDA